MEPPQSSPPSPPNALVAQGGQNNVSLSWAQPEFNGLSRVTGYQIYRGVSAGGETPLTNTSTTLSYVDSTVESGVTYYYYVKAVNAFGESDASNEAHATVGATPSLTGFVPNDSTTLFGASVVVATLAFFTLYRRRRRVLHLNLLQQDENS